MVTNCFKQKSTTVKGLVVLLIILIIILTALFINLIIRNDANICNTETCIKGSADIMRYVDQKVNPCEDFHTFSCGNYLKSQREFPVPEPEDEINALIFEMIQLNDTKPLMMQKLFYQSCLNLMAIEMDQEETIQELFYRLGEWPVLKGSKWNGTYFDWTDIIKRSRKLGLKFDWFLDFSVYEDVNNTRMNMLQIDVPRSLKPLPNATLLLRKELLTEIAIFMGAPKQLAHYETSKTIDFEEELGIIAEKHRRRVRDWIDQSPTKLAISEVQLLWPNIQWLELINNITVRPLSGSDYIIFNILDYLKDLSQLIMGTPKRIVADYMMWKLLEEHWPFLTKPLRDRFENYTHELLHKPPEFNRQRFCIQKSKKLFPLVADSVYVRRHVTPHKRQLVREMLFIIQRQYLKLLENASWMNRESRRKAMAKVHDLKFVIGGPEEVYDEFRFAERLGVYGFSFKSMNIIDMLAERQVRHYDHYYSVLQQRVMNNTVRFYQKSVNISKYSVVHRNTLVIPAASIRDTFYNPQMPNYLNYGTLGKELALEIFKFIHKEDEPYYDIEDYYHQNLWLTEVFDDAVRCLAKETSTFSGLDFNRKPKKLKEQLAYFVASDVAFESYREWSRLYSHEYLLPALRFTPQQLFWIQSLKFSCSKLYSKYDRDMARFKAIAPLRNSFQFAREFNCQEGSKMNPRRKCRVL